MSWEWAIFSYVVLWWIMLLTVLPLWVKQPTRRSPEHYAAAPEKPHLKRKLLLNSAMTGIVVFGIHLLLDSGVIDLRGG